MDRIDMHSNVGSVSDNFEISEITSNTPLTGSTESDLDNALTAALPSGNGGGFFEQSDELNYDALMRALPLYMHVRDPKAAAYIAAHVKLANRKRKFNKSNPALMAIMIVTDPSTDQHRQKCYDLSYVLKDLVDHGATADTFRDRYKETTAKECRDRVRDRRKVAKATSALAQQGADNADAGEHHSSSPNVPTDISGSDGDDAGQVEFSIVLRVPGQSNIVMFTDLVASSVASAMIDDTAKEEEYQKAYRAFLRTALKHSSATSILDG